ncbi:hypothetical protein RCO48_25285 [Peribacillus frigoritolerans]|nr:hypothetical protein [Peribacillus frigoritolerans]
MNCTFLCRFASSFVSHEGLSDKKKNSTGKEWEGSAWSIKSVATEEILRMIAEISTSLDRLEISYGETVNTVRCKLWAEQYTLVNEAQEAIEKAEDYWVNAEGVNHSFFHCSGKNNYKTQGFH